MKIEKSEVLKVIRKERGNYRFLALKSSKKGFEKYIPTIGFEKYILTITIEIETRDITSGCYNDAF